MGLLGKKICAGCGKEYEARISIGSKLCPKSRGTSGSQAGCSAENLFYEGKPVAK